MDYLPKTRNYLWHRFPIRSGLFSRYTNRISPMVLFAIFAALPLSNLGAYSQTTFYVRAGASGNNSGSDWNNAFTSLPSILSRGATYYIASGTYPGYIFDDPVDGTKYITVQKATQAVHGTAIGWQDSYALTPATWTSYIMFKTSYVVFDGATGGGPSNWFSGYGFKMSWSSNNTFIYLSNPAGGPSDRPNVDHITISHLELDGISPQPGVGCSIDATAANSIKSFITISYCYIHDIGGQGPYWINVHDIIFEYNYVCRNASSPTWHGITTELRSFSNFIIRYCVYADWVGTGAIVGYSGNIDALEVYGCVFVCTGSTVCSGGNGVIATLSPPEQAPNNWKVYNNSFINILAGPCAAIYMAGGSNNTAFNNILYNTATPSTFSGFSTHDYNWYDSGVAHLEPNGENGIADPFMDWRNGDFRLRQATRIAYSNLPSPYNRDIVGTVRGADGAWDRGAYEYLTGSTLSAPANLRIIK
jgi:hypothetical protein